MFGNVAGDNIAFQQNKKRQTNVFILVKHVCCLEKKAHQPKNQAIWNDVSFMTIGESVNVSHKWMDGIEQFTKKNIILSRVNLNYINLPPESTQDTKLSIKHRFGVPFIAPERLCYKKKMRDIYSTNKRLLTTGAPRSDRPKSIHMKSSLHSI